MYDFSMGIRPIHEADKVNDRLIGASGPLLRISGNRTKKLTPIIRNYSTRSEQRLAADGGLNCLEGREALFRLALTVEWTAA